VARSTSNSLAVKSSCSAAGAKVASKYASSDATASTRVLNVAMHARACSKRARGNATGKSDSGACTTAHAGGAVGSLLLALPPRPTTRPRCEAHTMASSTSGCHTASSVLVSPPLLPADAWAISWLRRWGR
jgi:hypothetical protein